MTEREVAQVLVRRSLLKSISRPGRPTEVLRLGVDPDHGDEILISLWDRGKEVQRFRCEITEEPLP
jgi:hypothetical protein